MGVQTALVCVLADPPIAGIKQRRNHKRDKIIPVASAKPLGRCPPSRNHVHTLTQRAVALGPSSLLLALFLHVSSRFLISPSSITPSSVVSTGDQLNPAVISFYRTVFYTVTISASPFRVGQRRNRLFTRPRLRQVPFSRATSKDSCQWHLQQW